MDTTDHSALIRASKRAEWFWLAAIAIACLVTAEAIYSEGWEQKKTMLLIPAIAGVWYGFRRSFRKRMERHQG
jgi:hypothetical protein